MTKKTLLLLAATLISSCSQDKVKEDVTVEKEIKKTTEESTDQEAKLDVVQAVKESDILIDVRSPLEFTDGHLKGSINIPHSTIAQRITEQEKNKDAKIVLYCRSGGRAGMAEKALRKEGYTNILNAGGFKELVEKGLPDATVE